METNNIELLRENAKLRLKLDKAEKALHVYRQTTAKGPSPRDSKSPEATDALQTEITERKRIEKAFKDIEYRYHSLFNQMSEGFALCEVVFDSENEPGDLRILEVNPAVEQLTRKKRADLVGKTIRQALPTARLGWIKSCGRVGLDGLNPADASAWMD